MIITQKSIRLAAGLSLAVAQLTGCGSASPFDYVKVRGKVLYEDGSPAPEGLRVMFASLAPPVGEQHPKPATAFVGPDGVFQSVTSYRPKDGLVRGKHKVLLIYEGPNANEVVPPIYRKRGTTPLEVDTADSPFELTIVR